MGDKIKELTKQGKSQREIALTLDISRDMVRYWQQKNNIKPNGYRETTKKCLCCNKEYTTRATNPNDIKFCSDRCRLRYWKKNVEKTFQCVTCGKTILHYKEKKYCNDECRPKAKEYIPKSMVKRPCLYCGSTFETKSHKRKYCNESCRYHYEKPIYNYKCLECGKWYSTARSKAQFCSSICGNKYKYRKRARERDKRIKENGPIDRDISIERLMIRDKGVCYLCQERVDIDSHHNNNYYPSIDHVIPIIRGGTHTWNNVKLAHRICNSLKKDTEI